MSYKVAVVGATGNVGREVLSILAEREFPVSEVAAIASRDSLGQEVSFGEVDILKVQALDGYDFADTDIAFFAAGSGVSKSYAQKAAQAGCVVIDKASFYRLNKDVPLIIPEVNPDTIADYKKMNIIAVPNCTVTPIAMVLKPLDTIARIKRVVVSTYQSVSGAGKEGLDELYSQTKAMFTYQEPEPKKFARQIAFNVIPQCGEFLEDGSTEEEQKIVLEIQKMLRPDIAITATCVRVPVFVGHSLALSVEFESSISVKEVTHALNQMAGVTVGSDYYTPKDAVREDNILVSRIRQDHSVVSGVNLWVVADNLRKGAALNAVQIAEALIKNYLS